MIALFADPGTAFGWALWDEHVLTSGTWDLRVRPDESSDFRLVRLRKKLQELPVVEFLFFESAGFTAYPRAAQIAGQLEAVMLLWAHDLKLKYKTVKPSELKKFATGKGNAGKDKMIEAAKVLSGYQSDKEDDNEADARLIGVWALNAYGVQEDKLAFAKWLSGRGV